MFFFSAVIVVSTKALIRHAWHFMADNAKNSTWTDVTFSDDAHLTGTVAWTHSAITPPPNLSILVSKCILKIQSDTCCSLKIACNIVHTNQSDQRQSCAMQRCARGDSFKHTHTYEKDSRLMGVQIFGTTHESNCMQMGDVKQSVTSCLKTFSVLWSLLQFFSWDYLVVLNHCRYCTLTNQLTAQNDPSLGKFCIFSACRTQPRTGSDHFCILILLVDMVPAEQECRDLT